MKGLVFCFILCVIAANAEPQNYRTTPVPILKQINRHNDDGSYSYGYEAADGTFKIETKYPTGEVFGKYGYVGDDGKVREIEYGASRRGFEPAGSDINVPPPTISSNPSSNSLDYDDGQYREDPAAYYKSEQRAVKSNNNFLQRNEFRNEFRSPPAQPAPRYNPAPPTHYNPAPVPAWSPPAPRYHDGHSAVSVDPHTGSYTLTYSG